MEAEPSPGQGSFSEREWGCRSPSCWHPDFSTRCSPALPEPTGASRRLSEQTAWRAAAPCFPRPTPASPPPDSPGRRTPRSWNSGFGGPSAHIFSLTPPPHGRVPPTLDRGLSEHPALLPVPPRWHAPLTEAAGFKAVPSKAAAFSRFLQMCPAHKCTPPPPSRYCLPLPEVAAGCALPSVCARPPLRLWNVSALRAASPDRHLHPLAAQVTPRLRCGGRSGVFPPPGSTPGAANPQGHAARKAAHVLVHGNFQTDSCERWLRLQKTRPCSAKPAQVTFSCARTLPPSLKTGCCDPRAVLMAGVTPRGETCGSGPPSTAADLHTSAC